MEDVVAAEAARYAWRYQRRRLAVLGVTSALVIAGFLSYRTVNRYPGDHGLEQLVAVDDYPVETWACVIEIFERQPIPGTVLGRFVVD